MKRLRPGCLVLLLLSVAFVLPLRAAPDSRIAGYWVSAPEETERAVFIFSIFGKWVIVSQHWAAGPADVKLKYTVVPAGDGGTLNADEPTAKFPGAPRSIRYELQSGELLLSFPETPHVGRYRLVKSTPPAAARPPATVDFSKPGISPAPGEQQAAQPAAPARQTFTLLGAWSTEPGVERQLTLFIAQSRTASVKINQQWTKGSDNPLVSKNGDYNMTYARNRGTLTQVKPDYEGSAIPPVLNFAIEGDALIVSVDTGDYAGQYRLIRRDARPKEAPAPRQT